jgi:23S rRNA (uridine2552-2'-O)-methyltransferase
VCAVDVLPVQGVQGVTVVQGDLRAPEVRRSLQDLVGPAGADVVLSDMAPNLSGIAAVDQARAVELAELALEVAVTCLRRGGTFLVKVFQGEGLEGYVATVRRAFADVERRKPGASRAHSRELYVLARGFGGV